MRFLILSLLAGLGLNLRADILEWEWAFNSSAAEVVRLNAVEVPEGGWTQDKAFACGVFRGSPFFPPQIEKLQSGETAGLVIRMDRNAAVGSWGVAWATQTESDAPVSINDLILQKDTNTIFVTGTFISNLRLGEAAFLPGDQGGKPRGFVAMLHPSDGKWLGGFEVTQLLPNSIALAGFDEIHLTGKGRLVAKFDIDGNLLWDVPEPPDTTLLRHIVTRPTFNNGFYSYVLGKTTSTAGGNDVFIASVDPGGSVEFQKFVSSPADEEPGGLAVSKSGLITFSLDTTDPDATYEGKPLDVPSSTGARESYAVRIDADAELLWSTRLSLATQGSSRMTTSDLALDPRGNAHFATNFSGAFTFEGLIRFGASEAGILSVDSSGEPYDFRHSSGSPEDTALGVAAISFTRQIMVGFHKGEGNSVYDAHSLPANPSAPRALAAFTNKKANQTCFIIRQPETDFTPPQQFQQQLLAILQQQPNSPIQLQSPAQIYLRLDYPDLIQDATGASRGVVGFAAFLTFSDADILQSQGDYVVEFDGEFTTSGTVSPAPWNLAKLNDLAASDPPGYSYDYPELCHPVRLYLIDTAVNDPGSSYFSSNTGLTLLDAAPGGYGELIRGTGDSLTVADAEHGTHMASLVAGPGHGVAQDLPLTMKIYDIYPSAGTTRASYLTSALAEAFFDRVDSANLHTPAAILIASTSVTPIALSDPPPHDTALGIALDSCLFAGIPVVMAAGNSGADAEDYYPSVFGDSAGVICTGAMDDTGAITAISNSGAKVGLMAPGHNNVVIDDASGLPFVETFSGTSAASALAAGALVEYHSANPWQYGGSLVANFMNDSVHASGISDGLGSYKILKASGDRPLCSTTYADWGAWFGLATTTKEGNDDGDFYSNLEEYVHGLNPLAADTVPQVFTIEGYSAPTLTMGFPIAWWLWNPAAVGPKFPLADGSTLLVIDTSEDLQAFSELSTTFTADPGCSWIEHLTFDVDTTSPEKEFFRVRLEQP